MSLPSPVPFYSPQPPRVPASCQPLLLPSPHPLLPPSPWYLQRQPWGQGWEGDRAALWLPDQPHNRSKWATISLLCIPNHLWTPKQALFKKNGGV